MTRLRAAATAALAAVLLVPAAAGAQEVTCAPAPSRTSLVRIERAQRPPGSGVVIVDNDDFAIIVTAKHVLQDPVLRPPEEFIVSFEAAPGVRVPVTWNDVTVFGWPIDGDLAVFRVNGKIPPQVTPEDPFAGETAVGGSVVAWGYPVGENGRLCSYTGRIRSIEAGQVVADVAVPEGVSGGPLFLLDPADGTPKLAGIVVRGDGGTTAAIDIRQVAAIVATSRDLRNGSRPHIWPNIRLEPQIVGDRLRSFKRIDAGPFTMGSSFGDERWPDADGGQKGEKVVTLPAFYMAKFEVTVDQYRECVKAGPIDGCTHKGEKLSSTVGDHPVTGVTWYDAVAYARWLHRSFRSRPDTPLLLRRLLDAGWEIVVPNEQEWEKAARSRGRDAYPWGNSPDPRRANYNSGTVKAVGAMACEATCVWGLEDMAGNVREWTRSLKLPYPYAAATADDPAATGRRTLRGGSFQKPSGFVAQQIIRATNRQEEDPSQVDQYTGFRVALVCRPEAGCKWRAPN